MSKNLYFPVFSSRQVDTIEKALVFLASHPTWQTPTAREHIEVTQECLARAVARPGVRP